MPARTCARDASWQRPLPPGVAGERDSVAHMARCVVREPWQEYPEGVAQHSPGLPGPPGNPGFRCKNAHNPEGVAQAVAILSNPFRVLVLDGNSPQGSPTRSGYPGLCC